MRKIHEDKDRQFRQYVQELMDDGLIYRRKGRYYLSPAGKAWLAKQSDETLTPPITVVH